MAGRELEAADVFRELLADAVAPRVETVHEIFKFQRVAGQEALLDLGADQARRPCNDSYWTWMSWSSSRSPVILFSSSIKHPICSEASSSRPKFGNDSQSS